LLHPTYDVDFSSKIFGQIRMRKLLNSTPLEYIKNFFKAFDQKKDVVITVKDVENPSLDKKSLIVLEFGDFKRQLTVSLFRALIPKEIKEIYEQKYDKDCENNHYKRLESLLLYRADKEIEVEEH
jgi:hypothetical protein